MIVGTGKSKICRTGQQAGNFEAGTDVANVRQISLSLRKPQFLLFGPFNQMYEAHLYYQGDFFNFKTSDDRC